jgi:hypothetical protein
MTERSSLRRDLVFSKSTVTGSVCSEVGCDHQNCDICDTTKCLMLWNENAGALAPRTKQNSSKFQSRLVPGSMAPGLQFMILSMKKESPGMHCINLDQWYTRAGRMAENVLIR